MQSKVAAKLARCNLPRWLKAGMETNVCPKFQIGDGFADIIIEGMWVHAEDIWVHYWDTQVCILVDKINHTPFHILQLYRIRKEIYFL